MTVTFACACTLLPAMFICRTMGKVPLAVSGTVKVRLMRRGTPATIRIWSRLPSSTSDVMDSARSPSPRPRI